LRGHFVDYPEIAYTTAPTSPEQHLVLMGKEPMISLAIPVCRSRAISSGTTPTIAISVAANLTPIAMIVGRIPKSVAMIVGTSHHL
jgi:hypothetical protein